MDSDLLEVEPIIDTVHEGFCVVGEAFELAYLHMVPAKRFYDPLDLGVVVSAVDEGAGLCVPERAVPGDVCPIVPQPVSQRFLVRCIHVLPPVPVAIRSVHRVADHDHEPRVGEQVMDILNRVWVVHDAVAGVSRVPLVGVIGADVIEVVLF